jgi:hypothetical protein
VAGAGGILIILLGALVGLGAGIATLALFAFGFRRLGPARARVATVTVAVPAFVAIVLTLPFWIVIVSGKDTRGEPFDLREIEGWMWLLLLTPPLTLVALAIRTARAR